MYAKQIEKNLKSSKEPSIMQIHKFIDKYIEYINFLEEIRPTFGKLRNPNFPSEISENIVRLIIYKKIGKMPKWKNTKKGDLYLENIGQIEIKAFSSDGPTSFGPKEAWKILYFIDCKEFMKKKFKVYEINLENTSDIFRNIKLTKKETFGLIADKNQRGKLRASFYKIFKPQLKEYCKCIFNGTLDDIGYSFYY